MAMKELGEVLKSTRITRGWTLRKAEEMTGVTNGYLSLLEQGTIKEPSPSILMKLSKAYSIEYVELMELAGYMDPKKGKQAQTNPIGIALSSALTGLSQKELGQVQEYIQFIKSSKKK